MIKNLSEELDLKRAGGKVFVFLLSVSFFVV